MAEVGSISTYECGGYHAFEWRIQDFFTLDERDCVYYHSPDFSFGGEEWYLGISPNGARYRDTSGHVDLWFFKLSSGPSITLSVSLSLKTAKGEKYREEHVTRAFDVDVNRFHIFNRFVPRAELTTLRSDLLPDDVLTVVCTMKGSTSAGSETGNIPEHAYVGASSQHVVASTQRVEAYAQTEEVSTQTVEVSTQTVEVSTQTVEVATQTVEEKCEACASGASTSSQEKKALQDYKQLFLEKEECDVTIRVKGSEFSAHRLILKARSPVLASTFRHDMKESATGVLEIVDCDPSSFSDFLCFLYCADVQLIGQRNVFDLFTLADKYQVLDLRSTCLEFVKNNLTVDTFCETLTLALRHSETELIKLCTDYFKKNAPKIIVTVKWQTFSAENPTESNELFIKLLVPNSS